MCSDQNPRACVELVIRQQRISEPEREWLRRIPSCESSWEPWQHDSSGASGLYQFMPSTFASTPYGGHSIYSAYWNTRAAAWGYRHLERGKWEWECTGILRL